MLYETRRRTCYSQHDTDRLGGSNVADVTRVVACVIRVHGVYHQMTTIYDLDATSTTYHSSSRTLPPETCILYMESTDVQQEISTFCGITARATL